MGHEWNYCSLAFCQDAFTVSIVHSEGKAPERQVIQDVMDADLGSPILGYWRMEGVDDKKQTAPETLGRRHQKPATPAREIS